MYIERDRQTDIYRDVKRQSMLYDQELYSIS